MVPGLVSLVGAGPGAADLLTLRAVDRLRAADVILYDRLSGEAVLEHADRDATRLCVGKAPGDAALPERWSQERINRLIVSDAKAGKRVVRLKCGDPGVFARGAEEAVACEAAGIAWEIVPGITAASAGMAAAGGFLTERREIETLVITTGTTVNGALPADFTKGFGPGTLLCIYMGVAAAPAIESALLRVAPPWLEVTIVARASQPDERQWACRLDGLAARILGGGVENPAVVMVRYRHSDASRPQARACDG